MKSWGIVAGVVVGLVVLALLGGSLLGRSWGPGYIGCPAWGGNMGGYAMGPGMMGGFGLLGWMFPLLGMLIPLALLALLVIGAVWAVQALTCRLAFAAGTPPSAGAGGPRCPHCERPVQADWKVCPHCGTSLES
jgi:hypothetical protein